MASNPDGSEPKIDAEAPIQFELESVESWKRVAHVSIDGNHFESERQRLARELAEKAQLPGFRKGKVPVNVIRTKYAQQVEQEALEAVIPNAYQLVVDSTEDLHPIAEPKVENLSMDEGAPICFDLVIEVRPDLEVTGMEGLAVERVETPITDDRVEQALGELTERNAKWEDVSRAAKPGDAMRISYVPMNADGTADEENRNDSYSLELGAEGVLPEFNSALEGLEVGEDTTVAVSYPDDYPREDLRGETMNFAVEVKEVREKAVPALDDEFAKANSEWETLEELRADLRKELEKQATIESDRLLHDSIVEKLADANDVPVPPSLEARYLQAMARDYEQMMGKELDDAQKQEFSAQFADRAKKAARRTILLDNIRRVENIEIGEEQVKAKIAELAAERGMETADYEKAVANSQNMERLVHDLEEEQLMALLCSKATITVVEKATTDPDSTSKE